MLVLCTCHIHVFSPWSIVYVWHFIVYHCTKSLGVWVLKSSLLHLERRFIATGGCVAIEEKRVWLQLHYILGGACSFFRDCMALARDLSAIGFLVLHAYLAGDTYLVCIDMVLSMISGVIISSNTLLALFFSVGMTLFHWCQRGRDFELWILAS